MLKIYHAPNTRGVRVIWLCEELGLAYQVELIDFSVQFRATAQWRALNPVGKVPVMSDGEITIFESGAMMDYLLGRYGEQGLRPAAKDPEYPYYLQWHWFAEATMARPLGEIVNHGREFPGDKRITAVTEEMANRAAACVEAVSQHMEKRTYLVADRFSAADISMGYSLFLAQRLIPESLPPAIMPYWNRLQERPGFQVAVGEFSASVT